MEEVVAVEATVAVEEVIAEVEAMIDTRRTTAKHTRVKKLIWIPCTEKSI